MASTSTGSIPVQGGFEPIEQPAFETSYTAATPDPAAIEMFGVPVLLQTVIVEGLTSGMVADFTAIEPEHVCDQVSNPRPKPRERPVLLPT